MTNDKIDDTISSIILKIRKNNNPVYKPKVKQKLINTVACSLNKRKDVKKMLRKKM